MGGLLGGSAAVVMGQGAAAGLLLARRYDGANQYADLAPGAYSDYTGYPSVNTPDQLQRTTNPTPRFPEFVSGHSTFSAAAALVLGGLCLSDGIKLRGTVKVKAKAIGVEGFTTPTQDLGFSWPSLPMAADSAGLSRRMGGIHFQRGDLGGRALGRATGGRVLARLRALFEGRTAY